MDSLETVKREIEQLAGIHDSDIGMFRALSERCSVLALAPAVAAGVQWGPGVASAATTAFPGVGTVAGATAVLLLMGAAWGASYAACMSLLPQLIEFRDALRRDLSMRERVRHDLGWLLARQRTGAAA